MIKFKSLKEYEELRNQDLVPPIIANAVIGDLLMIKEYLEEIQMTQDEFAKRLGITGKQVSLILQEKALRCPKDISADKFFS